MSVQQSLISQPANSQGETTPEMTRDHIRLEVIQNNLAGASKLLVELVKKYEPRKLNHVISLRRRVTEIEEIARMNTHPFELISNEKNQISLAILGIADEICSL